MHTSPLQVQTEFKLTVNQMNRNNSPLWTYSQFWPYQVYFMHAVQPVRYCVVKSLLLQIRASYWVDASGNIIKITMHFSSPLQFITAPGKNFVRESFPKSFFRSHYMLDVIFVFQQGNLLPKRNWRRCCLQQLILKKELSCIKIMHR